MAEQKESLEEEMGSLMAERAGLLVAGRTELLVAGLAGQADKRQNDSWSFLAPLEVVM